MAQLIFDLSGQRGLVEKFYGDVNDTASQPQRRYIGEEGQFADGIFNPMKRLGYLHPANNSFTTITGTTNAVIVATEYDSINDDAYFGEAGSTIWRLDGLSDTSFTADTIIAQTGTEVIRDMEIYELNGTRCLFYSYNITDGQEYFSYIGYKGLDSDSGALIADSTDSDNEESTDTITAGGTYQKLAQSYIIPGVAADGDTVTFDRVAVPLVRGAADNAGYNVTLSIFSDVSASNKALDLESTSTQYARITDASQTGLEMEDTLTFEAWIKPESQPSSSQFEIITKALTTGNQRGYRFGYKDDAGDKELFLTLSSDGTNEYTANTGALTTSLTTWKHIAVTWRASDGAVEFYLNGQNVGGGDSTLVPIPASTSTDGSTSPGGGVEQITNTTWQGRDVTIAGGSNSIVGVNVDFATFSGTPDGNIVIGLRSTSDRSGTDLATGTKSAASCASGDNTINFTIPYNATPGGTYFVYVGRSGSTQGTVELKSDNVASNTLYQSTDSGDNFSVEASNRRSEIQILSSSSSYRIKNTSAEFCIGSNDNETNPFDGLVDEVRIWDIVRTQTEIQHSYMTPLVGNESGLVGYWKLNNNYTDETSNNNDLSAINSPVFVDATDTDVLVHAPDTSADASSTIDASTIVNTATGLIEENALTYFTLSSALTKNAESMIFIVVEPDVFANMTGSDSLSWMGRTIESLPPSTDTSTLTGKDQQIYKYDGTAWKNAYTHYGNANGNDNIPASDFDFKLLLSSSQTWSYDLASGATQFQYNSDIFMVKADNGLMYVFEDNLVHKIDGTPGGGSTGTITSSVLRFPSYFKTSDAVDTRGRMYIAIQSDAVSGSSDARTYSEGICGIYIWDRQSTIFGTRDFIPLIGCRDIRKLYVAPNGDVRAICIGDDRFTQIRSISDGIGKILLTLGLSAYPEYRDSLKVTNNMAHWLGTDGIFYAHGSVKMGGPEELYKIGTMTGQVTGGSFTTGAIFIGDSNASESETATIFSFVDTTRRARKWSPNGIVGASQAPSQGDVYTLVKMLPYECVVRRMYLRMLPGTTSDSTTVATLKIYFNQSTTPWASKTITKADCAKGWKEIPINKPNINSMQLEIEWATGVNISADTFQPILAEVIYENEGRIENPR